MGYLGENRKRREDRPLLTGTAAYTDDFTPPSVTHAAVLRSPYGHATIQSIDTAAAIEHDGVIAVYTADDLRETGAPGTIRISTSVPGRPYTDFPLLATDRVRFAGQAVAVVVATDRYIAHEALDIITVEYDRTDAVVSIEDARSDDAPTIHDRYPDNTAFEWAFGDPDAVTAAIDDAAHVASVTVDNQRVIPNPMEPRAALAEYDSSTRSITVRMSTQTPHGMRSHVANSLGLPEHRVRVIAPAVGGGFGNKGSNPYSGEPLAAWCALQLERPVKWVSTRTEGHLADRHGRAIECTGTIGLNADGRILGVRVTADIDLGAYLTWGGTPAFNFRHLLSNAYHLPVAAGRMTGVFTHTSPIAPYRGAGRPEIVYLIERLIDEAATISGIDPVALRRRNMIPPDQLPYRTVVGTVYDSGEYERALDRALSLADYETYREKQAELRSKDRYLGIGVASFVENTGTAPGRPETGRVEFHRSGTVTAYCGTHDHGQGHGTTFAQVLGDELGIPDTDIAINEGDTADLLDGVGTFGSRSAPVGASALVNAARTVIEKARQVAAYHFEAAEHDIVFADGEFSVEGAPDRSLSIQDVARLIFDGECPPGMDTGLSATTSYDPENYAYAFGTHIAILEVLPETGEIAFERYVAVDDCGTQINPMIVEGQVMGGIAQGIGQALYEHAIYDDNGTLLSGSFQDYVLPKAFHIPEMTIDSTETPSPHTPTGAKGVGEGGTIVAPPAVANAVLDALRPLGVDHIDMPITPEAVWRACQTADPAP